MIVSTITLGTPRTVDKIINDAIMNITSNLKPIGYTTVKKTGNKKALHQKSKNRRVKIGVH